MLPLFGRIKFKLGPWVTFEALFIAMSMDSRLIAALYQKLKKKKIEESMKICP